MKRINIPSMTVFWFICVLQAILGMFIRIVYIYNSMPIDIAFKIVYNTIT